MGLEPGGVFIERLVEVLRAAQWDMAELDGKGTLGLFGWFTAPDHEVECRGEAGPVRSRFAMNQERIGAVLENVDQDRAARAGSAAESRSRAVVKRHAASRVPSALPRSYHQSAGPPPRRLRIDLMW